MTGQLDPAVARKLDDFRSRRRRLILFRGLCAALVALILALIVVVLADWLLFLPEPVRWLLSSLAYGCVAVVAWLTCLRWLRRPTDLSDAARLIETVQPDLREDLVSAVELGDPASQKPWHSQAFRSFLQQNVADKMGEVNVSSLLPWALVHRWIHLAMVAAILFMTLLCIPGLHFGRRVTRALLPMASVDRVSLTQIEILSPDPPDTAVAVGEEIEVLVRIGGAGKDDDVTLQTTTDRGESVRVPMTPAAGSQRSFRSTVRMGRESVRYRVWANDARTDEHLLMSRQRPQVISFEKTYRFPDYLQRPARTESNNSGDLVAVEGTEVDLVVQVSQPVTLAHLMIDSQSGKTTVPMIPVIGSDGALQNRMRATVALTSSGTYRIRLVAAETGLENKFSPEYALGAEPDKAPTIRIDRPPLAILVPSDEVVSIVATAEDDWALERVEQQVRIGDGPWQSSTIVESSEAVANVEVEHRWDIYPYDLEPGSVLFTKLVAVDRKGSRGESQTIRAVISSHEFDPGRWSALADARSAQDALRELVLAAGKLKEATLAASDAATKITAMSAADDCDQRAGGALAAVLSAVESSPGGRDSIDLVLVGRAISQASSVGVGFVRKHLAADDFDEARKAAEFVHSRAGQAADSYDHLLRLSEIAAITNDLLKLRRLHREAIQRLDVGTAQRLDRRMQAIGGEAAVMADVVAAMNQHADENESIVLKQIESDLLQLKELGNPFGGPLRKETIRQAEVPLQTALENSMSLFRETLLDSVQPRKALLRVAGDSHSTVTRAADYVRQQHELSGAALDAAVTEWMATASLEQKRPDSNAPFVADASRAWRAIEAIRFDADAGGDDQQKAVERLEQLAGALEVLTLVQQTDDLIGIVAAIAGRDSAPRQESAPAEQAADAMISPSDWFCAESQFQSLVSRLRQSSLPGEATEIIHQSRQSDGYRQIRQEMVDRPQLQRNIQTKTPQLGQLLADLKRARDLMQDDLEEARRLLQQLSPRLDQMLAQLAEKVSDDAEQLEEFLDDTELAADEIADEVQQEQQELDQLDNQLDEIRDALREDAAEQDLMQEEGRQRMRDDDDALAMLEDQPEPARSAVEEAAQEDDPQQQRDALAEAASRQAELAEQLQQLAEHFENLHEGDAAESRQQLRQAEEELGIREQLDRQQEELEQLAALADLPPEEALQALENELADSEPMQRELDDLNRQQLQQTQSQLQQAEQQQRQVADDLQQQADSVRRWNEQLSSIGRQASELAENEVAAAEETLQQQQAEERQPGDQPGDLQPQQADQERGGEEPPEENADTEQSDAGQSERRDAAERAAEAMERAEQQLAEAAEQSETGSDSPQVSELAEAAEQVAQSLRGASDQLEQASRQAERAQPNGEQNESASGAEENNDSSETSPGEPSSPAEQAAQAADQASQLTEQAEQLAAELQRAADGLSESSAENVRDGPAQQAVERALQEAEQELSQAARNEQRLGNDDNADRLERIADATEQASQLLEQTMEQTGAQQQPPTAQTLEDAGRQLDAVEQAIAQPAEELENFLAGEADSASPSEPGESEPASDETGQPGMPEPGGSDPEASPSQQPGGSEPGGSEEAGSEPGESATSNQETENASPSFSRSIARQLAEALNELDRQVFAPPGEANPGSSSPGDPSNETPSGEASAPSDNSDSAASESGDRATGQPSGAPASQSSSSETPSDSSAASGQPGQSGQPGDDANQPSDAPSQSSPASGSSPAESGAAADAISAAAQSRAREIARSRGSSTSPSSDPSGTNFADLLGGAAVEGGAASLDALPPLGQMKKEDWAKLPPKIARDLLDGRREKISPEYRRAIETYFRLIAEKSRKDP